MKKNTYLRCISFCLFSLMSNYSNGKTITFLDSSFINPSVEENTTVNYCVSGGVTSGGWIDKVKLENINNVSGDNNGYADFTNLVTDLDKGTSYDIDLKPKGLGGPKPDWYWRVWIDFNHDLVFDDINEMVFSTGPASNTVHGVIAVPSNALLGNTTMRVIMRADALPWPCDNAFEGEVEDYSVNITTSCCYPGVLTDNTLTGDGYPSNELSVNLSTDANNQLSLGSDGALFVAPDGDNDPNNELQDWSNLPGIPSDFSDGVDNVDDADNDPNNELQDWSNLPGIPSDFSDGVDNVDDADNDPNNELNATFQLNGTTLELTDAGGTLSADLSSLSGGGGAGDVDWYKANTTTQPTSITDDIFTEGKVGIGLTNPNTRLHVKGYGNTQYSNTALFENQNGAPIFWMKDNGSVYVGEDVYNTSGGKLHVVSNEPESRGIVIQNKNTTSASASAIHFYVGDGFGGGNEGVGTLGYFADIGKVRLSTNRPYRVQAPEIELHVDNESSTIYKSLRLRTSTGTDLLMNATAYPGSNMLTTFEGGNALFHNTANKISDGSAEIWNTADSKSLSIRTFSPAYPFAPFLAGKTVISANHDIILAPDDGSDLHFGKILGGLISNMVVKSNGDVGIGTTTPIEKLHVAGNVLAVAHLNISDKRFKKDIRQLENVMGNIQQLEGYSYQYRTEEFRNKGFSEGNQVGLIAQNVEKVYPELVKTYEDGYKAVNYDGLIPVLIEGIKEQQQQISSLEEENANIRREIEELKGLIELVRTEFNESSTAINRTRVDLGNTQSIVLNQNSPNPFKERTTIGYVVPDNIEKAHIFIFDLNGQIMKKVELPSGEGVLEVFASDLSSGMYSYSLVIDGNVVDTKKMTVTK